MFDLARRIYHGLPWPDGTPNTLAKGGKTLWVAADNQWAELTEIGAAFGLPDEAIILNAPASDPYSGTSLESEEELKDLEDRIGRTQPVLCIIDTITNTSDLKSQDSSDAKKQYKPLQEIANKKRVAIVCVTHLNAGGKALGRRVMEKVRVALYLSCPDPDGQPDRRKLWVEKSKAIRPPALGVTMGGEGNEYDEAPPEPPGVQRLNGAKAGPLPVKTAECMGWLRKRLKFADAKVGAVRSEAEAAGYGSTVLYRAMKELGVEECERDGRKWWCQLEGEGEAAGDDGPPF
jgi:hypothetical protein